MRKRNLITLIFGLVIGTLLLIAWLHFNPLQEIRNQFANLNYKWVLLASIVYLSAYFIRSWRWNLLLRMENKPGLFKTWMYAMGGNLVNYVIPIRLGNVVRAWFIKRNQGVPILKTLPSVFIDKAFDTLGIFFVLILLPFLAVEVSLAMMVLLCLLIVVFVLTIGLLLFAAWHKDFVIKVLQSLVSWLPAKIREKLNFGIILFIGELNLFEHNPTVLLFAVVLTACGVLLDGTYFFLLFTAFGISYPFALAMFGYTLINLSYALPQPPIQLGSNEWMMIIVFSIGFGLTKSSASAIMAFAHILTFFLMTACGTFAFIVSGKEVISKIFKGEKIDD